MFYVTFSSSSFASSESIDFIEHNMVTLYYDYEISNGIMCKCAYGIRAMA